MLEDLWRDRLEELRALAEAEERGPMADPGRPVEVTLVIAPGPGRSSRYFTGPTRRAELLGHWLADGGRFRDPTAAGFSRTAGADLIERSSRAASFP